MFRKYTPEEIKFIKDNVTGRTRAELTDMFNRRFGRSITSARMGSIIHNHKLNPRARHAPEEIQFIRKNLPGRSCTEITDMFNRHFGRSLTRRQMEARIRRRRDLKDLKEMMRTEKYEAGAEVIRPRGHTVVKISKTNEWKLKNRIIWEKANGPIPEGHIVIFADGNKSNFDLDNLILVSRSELAVMNHLRLIFTDKDLTKAGKAVANLKLLIAEREREIGARQPMRRKKRNE
jgi:hypothetical protein